jgi:hypothetical protein
MVFQGTGLADQRTEGINIDVLASTDDVSDMISTSGNQSSSIYVIIIGRRAKMEIR